MSRESTTPTALVVGATGIAGQTISRQLVDAGWTTYGLSRGGSNPVEGVVPVAADLLDPESLTSALGEVDPEIVFITAWMKQDSEAANIEVNSATVRNVLTALKGKSALRHVGLLTGLKHYLGPFDNYATGVMADTPFHENEPRLDSPNFYYAQEDELFAAATKLGFTWSVHRAHTVFGFAVGNAMNMVLTLGVYAEICRETGAPFVFPGSQTQWNGLTDITDADLLGEQMIWAATRPEGANEAFNIANGDVFRWRWMWPKIAEVFGVDPVGFSDTPQPLADRMDDAPKIWAEIAAKNSLAVDDVDRLASWWHTDSDLGRNIECLTDMTKSRQAGFLGFRSTFDSFVNKTERYRSAGILPTR
ncbi:NAD dependent epimerase/dehydratase [Rhodococcoides trifolii]|uniref:NAD dependent epimerase/dehydratase n=1 Tax=Rhodococcoides trifolii TaxID=908250 RepID=A0A917G0C4_9NOCA|nr:SDR family oxidoreductase [Rhodococcus trifolii]GGG16223.1 NAD dependent epimerase/dehydratase [Rhodococcus trifolii]